MSVDKTAKNKFRPLFDYMDAKFDQVNSDLQFLKEQFAIFIVHIDQSNRKQEIDNKRWELNDRRLNRQTERLQDHEQR